MFYPLLTLLLLLLVAIAGILLIRQLVPSDPWRTLLIVAWVIVVILFAMGGPVHVWR